MISKGGREPVSRWKSAGARETFRRLYEDASMSMSRELEEAGLPPSRVIDVDTAFGTTRCHHWSGAGEPLVLLHGHNGSWLSWGPLLRELRGRDVYALDTIGEPGGSVQALPITTANELADWLSTTAAALGLSRFSVAGMSYGGWIAVHYAARHGHTLSSLVLLDPAIGTVTMKRVLRQGMLVGLAQILPGRLRRLVARRIDAEPVVFDTRLRKGPSLAFRKFDRRIPTYATLEDPTPDAVLGQVAVPTLLVLAGRSELHDIVAVADKARRLIGDLEVATVDGASHAMPITQPKAVAEIVLPFLDRVGATGAGTGRFSEPGNDAGNAIP